MAILVILSGRLVHLQWYNRDELAQQATTQQFHTITIPARYGEIRDRTGRIVMATTVKAKSLFVNPSLIENRWQVSMQIGDALSIDPDRLMLRLARHGEKQFVWIKRRRSRSCRRAQAA
jgi:cell division protein FtsI/penicillin-binding protein 2